MTRAARTVIGLALGLGLGCQAKVDPRSPFDEDDPRALREDAERAKANDAAGGHGDHAPVTEPPPPPLAVPGGARAGSITRDELKPYLDAGPAAFLAWFETEAATDEGRFVGWRLVKLLPEGRALAALDLVPDDVLVAINGRPLQRPDEMSDLWTELYGAGAIVAEIRRGPERFTLRYTISGPPLPAPPAPAMPR